MPEEEILAPFEKFAAKHRRKLHGTVGVLFIVAGTLGFIGGPFHFPSFWRAALHFGPPLVMSSVGILYILLGIFKKAA